MEAALLDPNGGQRWCVYDEAWRDEPSRTVAEDGCAPAFGPRLRNAHDDLHKITDLDNVGDQGSAMRSLANSLLANG